MDLFFKKPAFDFLKIPAAGIFRDIVPNHAIVIIDINW